jgi:hypothetical protein
VNKKASFSKANGADYTLLTEDYNQHFYRREKGQILVVGQFRHGGPFSPRLCRLMCGGGFAPP